MKVVILAGGIGSRLGNLTEAVPKPMVKIGDWPILWHIMKIYSHFGHKDFVLALGYKAEVIKSFFYDYHSTAYDFTVELGSGNTIIHQKNEENDWRVTCVSTGLDSMKGARLKKLEKYLDDINMLTYGDGVANININSLIDYHNSHGKMVTITGVHPPARFGELIENDGQLINFEEKPQASIGMINGGFMVFNKKLLNYLTEEKSCDTETMIFPKLSNMGEIMVYRHVGDWECVDNERDLIHLNMLWNQGKAFWKVW